MGSEMCIRDRCKGLNGTFQTGDLRIADSFENRDSVGDAILPNGIAILALYQTKKKERAILNRRVKEPLCLEDWRISRNSR